MIADAIDYLLHGRAVAEYVDLDNPHTVAKIAIAQARQNADLWSMAWNAHRMTAVERREWEARKQAQRPAGRLLVMQGR